LDAAVEHMNEMRLDPALALLEPLCADDLDAQTPADRVALATALCLKGLVLDRLKRHEEAFEAHRRCLKRYGMVLEPGVQECVTRCRDSDAMRRALERNPTMLAELPAAHHALRLSTNLDQAATIQTELTDHPEVRTRPQRQRASRRATRCGARDPARPLYRRSSLRYLLAKLRHRG
jgi:hypothetical protein